MKALLPLIKMADAKEREERAARLEAVQVAVSYKAGWLAYLGDCRRRAVAPEAWCPHPDDIVIDGQALEVRFNGPRCPDDKKLWDEAGRQRDLAEKRIGELLGAGAGRGRRSAAQARELAQAQEIALRMSAMYPDRQTRRRVGFDLERHRRAVIELMGRG